MPSHLILITFIHSLSHSQNICINPLFTRTWCRGARFSEYKKNLFLGSQLQSREVSLDYSLWSIENLGSAQWSYKEEEHNENKWPNRDGKEQGKENTFLAFEDIFESDTERWWEIQRGKGPPQFRSKRSISLCTSLVFRCLDFRHSTV